MVSNQTKTVVLGAGGHAAVVIDALIAAGQSVPVAVLDPDNALWGTDMLGVPVVGGDDRIDELIRDGVNGFLVGVGSTGDATIRRKLFDLGVAHQLAPVLVRHPTAVCSSTARVADSAQLLAGSIVCVRAEIGNNVIINTGGIVEHDCKLADHVHVATGATLAGAVRVAEGAHVGAGATVRQGITIGAGSIVGAGAVVVKDVPPQTTVVGVPARPLMRTAS